MAQEGAQVLGRLRAADQDQRARRSLLEFGHGLGQHPPAGLVVAAVEPDLGAVRREIDERSRGAAAAGAPAIRRRSSPRSQARGGKVRRDGAQARRCAVAALLMLVAPGEARQRQIEQAALVLEDEPAVLLADDEILAGDDERRADARRLALRARAARRAPAEPMIAGAPRLKMPAFSEAIFSTVSPRNSGWSSETGVMIVAVGAAMTLVAS